MNLDDGHTVVPPRDPLFYPETERVDDPQRRLGRAIWWGLTALGLHGAQWASLLAGALLTAYAISKAEGWTAVGAVSAYMLLVNGPLWLTRPRTK